MKAELAKLIRPNILELSPYSSARGEYSGSEQDMVYLDANENPLGSATSENFNRYPDPNQSRLKAEIALLKKVKSSQIFLGNGSDEAIDLLIRACCQPAKDSIITCPPTYGMYRVAAAINETKIVSIPLTASGFNLDVESILAEQDSKLLFLCSPNNPTGNCLKAKEVEQVLKSFRGLVIVDEAYIDFAPKESFLPLLSSYPNLVVLQTFSKAWGLAGLRLGVAYLAEELAQILSNIKPPYNINQKSLDLVRESLLNRSFVEESVQTIVDERNKLAQNLIELDLVIKVYPSQANFLLVKVKNALATYKALLTQGIVVRDRSRVTGCADCLRFTVGTAAENQLLLKALRSL